MEDSILHCRFFVYRQEVFFNVNFECLTFKMYVKVINDLIGFWPPNSFVNVQAWPNNFCIVTKILKFWSFTLKMKDMKVDDLDGIWLSMFIFMCMCVL